MPVQAVMSNENLIPVELSPEEQEVVRARIKAVDALLKTEKHAKYKIELFFGAARTVNGPTPGLMSFWESGTKLHGGGDSKIYMCPGKYLKRNECEAPIPESATVSGLNFCAVCRTTWKGDEVIGEIIANLPMRKWAELLLRYFIRMEHNADIYLKHAKTDIRSHALREQEKDRGGELVTKTRTSRALHIYPLKNIIKDTSAGADLLVRFNAFLTA